MATEEEKAYLKSIYFDPKHEASFGGIDGLYRFVRREGVHRISRKSIQEWLQSNEVYSTHVKKNKDKHWYGMTVPHPGYLYDVDTAYFDGGNRRYPYFVTMIDAFSRKSSARAVKDLKAVTVRNALREMFDEMGDPLVLRSDRGKEYKNATLKAELSRRNIKQVFSFPPHKSSLAERMIRVIKSKLYKIMQARVQRNWWQFLDQVIHARNAAYHRALGMAPNDVTNDKIPQLWYKFKQRRLKGMPPHRKFKFDINDGVRVTLTRSPMAKEHNELNSTVVYYVTHRYSKSHVHRYKLKDNLNTPLEGSFTQNQLELTFVDENTVWRVERVLHYAHLGRGRDRALYGYVKWANMPKKYNSYTLAANLVNLSDTVKK